MKSINFLHENWVTFVLLTTVRARLLVSPSTPNEGETTASSRLHSSLVWRWRNQLLAG